MATIISVPQGYGSVLLLSLGLIPVMAMGHGTIVGRQRKAAKVPYPNCYATAQEMKANPAAYKFNCAQRAHAQFLENMPQMMISMLVAGLVYPQATAACGLGWLVSRALYGYGYIYSGKDQGKGRMWGSTFWLFQAGVWGMCLKMGYDLL